MKKKRPDSAKKGGSDHTLAMTVYDLPGQTPHHASKHFGRWKLLLLLLVCALPVIASYLTYYVIKPEARRNYGLLVEPQRPIPDLAVQDATLPLDSQTFSLTSLKGQWLLISISDSRCNTSCEENLYLQRQLRAALGKDRDRLDWVWFINDEGSIPKRLALALHSARVIRVPPTDLKNWLDLSPTHEEQTYRSFLYLVDPLGNLMMRFPDPIDGRLALKDLRHLMRASASWDKAGR
jgi:hypothetical protein